MVVTTIDNPYFSESFIPWSWNISSMSEIYIWLLLALLPVFLGFALLYYARQIRSSNGHRILYFSFLFAGAVSILASGIGIFSIFAEYPSY